MGSLFSTNSPRNLRTDMIYVRQPSDFTEIYDSSQNDIFFNKRPNNNIKFKKTLSPKKSLKRVKRSKGNKAKSRKRN